MQKRSRFSLALVFSFVLLAGVCIPALAYRIYRVQPGDTVYQVSHWYGITAEQLTYTNGLAKPGYIIPRQVLLIPQPSTRADEKLYTVRPGDTLFSIAQAFKTDLNWLRTRNQLTANEIYAGQMIKVPAPPAVPVKPQPTPEKPPAPPETGNPKPKYVWNIPDLLARYPGKVFLRGTSESKKVALTFDDGPDVEYTTKILDILSRLGVKATFFLKGDNIEGQEWVVSRMIKEGHIVANHSFTHPNLRKMSPERILNEVTKTEELIENITGKETALLRPPYGEMSEEGLDHLVADGYQMINWSVDSGDWSANSADQVLVTTLPQIQPGSILLFHSAGGEGQDLTPTVEATEDLIHTLYGLGYEIVPLTELIPVKAYK